MDKGDKKCMEEQSRSSNMEEAQHEILVENTTTTTAATAAGVCTEDLDATLITIRINCPQTSCSGVVVSKCKPGVSVDLRHECVDPESFTEECAENSLSNHVKVVKDPCVSCDGKGKAEVPPTVGEMLRDGNTVKEMSPVLAPAENNQSLDDKRVQQFGSNAAAAAADDIAANDAAAVCDNVSANDEAVANDNAVVNYKDGITGKDCATANTHVTGKDGATANKHAIGKDGATANKHAIGKDGATANKHAIGKDGATANKHAIGKDGITGKDGATANKHAIGKDGITGKDGATANKHATGKDGITGKDGATANTYAAADDTAGQKVFETNEFDTSSLKTADETEKQLSELEDSICESESVSVLLQVPSNSPWGPPHGSFPHMPILNIDNHYNRLQVEIRDPCSLLSPDDNGNPCRRFQNDNRGNCYNNRFLSDTENFFNRYQTEVDSEKKCSATKIQQFPCTCTSTSSVSLSCDGSEIYDAKSCRCCHPCNQCTAHRVHHNNQCFVYPVYCIQSMQCCTSRPCCKGGKGKEQRKPLNINVVSFPPPHCHFDSSYCKSTSSASVEDKCSQLSIPSSVGSTGFCNDNVNRRDTPRHSAEPGDTDKRKNLINCRPPTILCYICGREYGTASISIHEKRCLEKWRTINSRLPKGECHPEPVKLPISVSQPDQSAQHDNKMLSGKKDTDLSAVNKAAFESFQQQYVKCDKCDRTFLPEGLKHHARGCRGFYKIV